MAAHQAGRYWGLTRRQSPQGSQAEHAVLSVHGSFPAHCFSHRQQIRLTGQVLHTADAATEAVPHAAPSCQTGLTEAAMRRPLTTCPSAIQSATG